MLPSFHTSVTFKHGVPETWLLKSFADGGATATEECVCAVSCIGHKVLQICARPTIENGGFSGLAYTTTSRESPSWTERKHDQVKTELQLGSLVSPTGTSLFNNSKTTAVCIPLDREDSKHRLKRLWQMPLERAVWVQLLVPQYQFLTWLIS